MFSKNVDSIVKSFNNIISDLDTLIDKNKSKSENNYQHIMSLTTDNKNLEVENSRATKIKNNISNLINI